MMDGAYTVPVSIKNTAKRSEPITIGLSLHAWRDQERAVAQLLRRTVATLAKNHSLKILLIPHHIVPKEHGPDLACMLKILAPISNKISIVQPNVQELQKMNSTTLQYIKQCTAEVDLLITSRYHGIIFACSANVPVVALNYDTYYSLKNVGALQTFYRKDFTRYYVSLTSNDVQTDLLNKTQSILKNLPKEKKILHIYNGKMKKAQKFFNTFLIE